MRPIRALLALCLLAAAAFGRPPPPVDVPGSDQIAQDDANLALKRDLDDRHAALVDQYNDYLKQADAYDATYNGMSSDDPQYPAGQAAYANLLRLYHAYLDAANAFKADVGNLRLASAPPAPSGPVVDPRTLITADDYQDALRAQQPLLKQQQGLQAELAKLQAWQQGLQADTNEFAKIQQEAQIDYMNDVLLKLPVGDILDGFVGSAALTSDEAAKIKTGFDALKGLINLDGGIETDDSGEKFDKIMEANKSFKEAMMDQTMAKLKSSSSEDDQKSYEYLENAGKIFDVAIDMIRFSQQKDQSGTAWAKFGVQLFADVVPVANTGIAIESLGEKKLTQAIVQAPLDSLNQAMSGNFNAQRYLQSKLDPIDAKLSALQETIDNYRAVHPDAQ
jgi:hypothetical protein